MNFDLFTNSWLEKQLSDNPEKMFAFFEQLQAPRFSVSQMGISRQELLYWKKLGVLVLPEPESTEKRVWNKVNFYEYCWLQLVVKLREMNMPVEVIAKLRNTMFDDNDDFFKRLFQELNKFQLDNPAVQKVRKEYDLANLFEHMPPWFFNTFKKLFSPFNLIILRLMTDRTPMNILVKYDGDCILINEDSFKKAELISLFFEFIQQPFVNIPLADLLDGFYSSDAIKSKDKKAIFNLTDRELKVLELLRTEGIKEIKIRLTENQRGQILIETLEQKSLPQLETRIASMLKKNEFQNIRLYAEKGHLLLFEETKKIRI